MIKEQMSKNGRVQEKKGKIILAMVKGDIHDIGKNIVKVLLENYCYDVIDLGKDVPPELVVETAVAQKVPLVGLSAVMTKEYAGTIGADQYCKDAMASVNYAESLNFTFEV